MSILFACLARLYARWLRTLRIRIVLPDGTVVAPSEYVFGPDLYAVCERDLLLLGRMTRETPITVMVALGRDGDWATAAARSLGCSVVRGSSRRGGTAALLSLVRTLSETKVPAVLVVDGPLGPSGVPKGGILHCGGASGRAVTPVGAAASPALVVKKAWSKIYLPLPFSRATIVVGEAILLERPPRAAERGPLLSLLEGRLRAAREGAVEDVERTRTV
jgi:lysophospholipid acyltransferase (LPLAT)-like uncharacterized protein